MKNSIWSKILICSVIIISLLTLIINFYSHFSKIQVENSSDLLLKDDRFKLVEENQINISLHILVFEDNKTGDEVILVNLHNKVWGYVNQDVYKENE